MARGFNGLDEKEWTSLSRNVITIQAEKRDKKRLQHGATFPPELARRLIIMYSKKGDLILDPFAGIGTTLQEARATGRDCIGIEINPAFVKHARAIEHQTTLLPRGTQTIVEGDCRRVRAHVPENSVQLVLTSPPYANAIAISRRDRVESHKNSLLVSENNSSVSVYSDNPRDLGNLSYKDFLSAMKGILYGLYDVTKGGGYCIFIVKDSRDTKHGIPYVPLHSDLATLGVKAGFLYHDLIIWDQNENRRLVILGFPTVFYTNQNCTFIVILRKKDK